MTKDLVYLASVVQDRMQSDGGAHDWFHVSRVMSLSSCIAYQEHADQQLVLLCALFHDISDVKLNGGDENRARLLVEEILLEQGYSVQIVKSVADFVSCMGFRRSRKTEQSAWCLEWKVVQDADYLDAIGAVGIARSFWFGGYRKEPICRTSFIPDVEILAEGNFDEKSVAGHFSEKLLRLKSMMLTATGKKLARRRHFQMVRFLKEFRSDWNQSIDFPLTH